MKDITNMGKLTIHKIKQTLKETESQIFGFMSTNINELSVNIAIEKKQQGLIQIKMSVIKNNADGFKKYETVLNANGITEYEMDKAIDFIFQKDKANLTSIFSLLQN